MMAENRIRFFVNEHAGFVDREIPSHFDVDTAKCAAHFAKIRGNITDNRIIVGSDTNLSRLSIVIKGSNNLIVIGSSTLLRGNIGISGHNLTVYIGAYTTFNSVNIFCKGKNNSVYIGRDCMFSAEIEIRTSDSHAVVDLETKQKINKDKGVYIGDHVWVAKRALIQKGAYVPSDSIIGFNCMVNSKLDEPNSAYAGAPARAVRSGVTWSRRSSETVDVANLYSWQNYPEL